MKPILLLPLLLLGSNLAMGASYFEAFLDGPSEEPPNASPATGYAQLKYDGVARTLEVAVSFSGLTAGNTAAHIHGPTTLPGTGTAGVMTPTPTFPSFPTGATFGDYWYELDLSLASSYRAGFLSGFGGNTLLAEAAMIGAIEEGKAYLNIHTSTFPGGEIRGFFQPIPESGTWMATISLGGLVGTVVLRRSRRPA